MGKCRKNYEEKQCICKRYLMICLRFEEISLHSMNMDVVFINFVELWVAFFQLI